MESFLDRYRNPMILGAVLLSQLLGLAVQVKRSVYPQNPEAGSVRLIRLWAATVVTPIELIFHAVVTGTRTAWHDYVNVSSLRHENQALRDENEQLRIVQARLNEDANQAHRLQALLDFKEKFVSRTLAAQVVGASASEQSRVLYIDKGSRDGLQPGMAVITPQGIVGKVRDVFPLGSQVLVINDTASGVGANLEKSRIYGVVKGKASGEQNGCDEVCNLSERRATCRQVKNFQTCNARCHYCSRCRCSVSTEIQACRQAAGESAGFAAASSADSANKTRSCTAGKIAT